MKKSGKTTKEPADKALIAQCKFLIKRFISEGKEVNWGKEIKVAKKLLLENPDIEFWSSCSIPPNLDSLVFFISSFGKTFISNQKNIQKLEMPVLKRHTLQEEKIGEDMVIPNILKKTLLDYLK